MFYISNLVSDLSTPYLSDISFVATHITSDANYQWDLHLRPIAVTLVDAIKKSVRIPLPKDRPLKDLLVHPEQRAALKQISVKNTLDLLHDVLLPDALRLMGRCGVDVLDIRNGTQVYDPKLPGNVNSLTAAAYLLVGTHADGRWLVYPGSSLMAGVRLRNHHNKINLCKRTNHKPKKNSGVQHIHRVLADDGWDHTLHIIATFTKDQYDQMPLVETILMLLFKSQKGNANSDHPRSCPENIGSYGAIHFLRCQRNGRYATNSQIYPLKGNPKTIIIYKI